MSYDGGVLSTAPCDPTQTWNKMFHSEALGPRNCIKEVENVLLKRDAWGDASLRASILGCA